MKIKVDTKYSFKSNDTTWYILIRKSKNRYYFRNGSSQRVYTVVMYPSWINRKIKGWQSATTYHGKSLKQARQMVLNQASLTNKKAKITECNAK